MEYTLTDNELKFIDMISKDENQRQKLINSKLEIKKREWEMNNRSSIRNDKTVRKFVKKLRK